MFCYLCFAGCSLGNKTECHTWEDDTIEDGSTDVPTEDESIDDDLTEDDENEITAKDEVELRTKT